jgi:hypothetical protein
LTERVRSFGSTQNEPEFEARRRLAMANRQQKSNREKRKPKAEKPKPPAQVSPFARMGAGSVKGGAGKKAR